MLFAEGIEGEDTKSTARRMVESIWSTGSISTKADGDDSPMFYVINFADSMGFAIAGADRRIPPVVYLTDRGTFNEGDTLSNPGLVAMLSKIETESRMLLALTIRGKKSIDYSFEEYGRYVNLNRDSNFDLDSCDIYWTLYQMNAPVGTQVGCNWDQDDPFNAYCYTPDNENAPAGCVPVSVAQVMYYHKKNTVYDGVAYNWNSMQYVVDRNSMPIYSDAWPKVKLLMATLGAPDNLNATYTLDGTSASNDNVERTFENFGYQNGGTLTKSYQYSLVSSEIVSGYPVIMGGDRIDRIYSITGVPIDTTYSGHNWVIDQTMNVLWRMWVVHKRTG